MMYMNRLFRGGKKPKWQTTTEIPNLIYTEVSEYLNFAEITHYTHQKDKNRKYTTTTY